MNIGWIITAILLWFVLGAIVPYFARKKMGEGMDEYFIAGRKIGGFIGAMTLSATVFSAFMMVGLVGFVYGGGIAAIGFELSYLISALLIMVFLAPRFMVVGKKYGYLTPSQLLGDRYENRAIPVMVGILFIIVFVPYTSAQCMGAGLLAEGLSGGAIPFWLGSLILPVIAFIYAWWAGMRSVAWTDALMGFIMIIAGFALLGFVLGNFFPEGYFSTIQSSIPGKLAFTWPLMMWLGLAIPWLFCQFLWPQCSQRWFIVKDVKALRTQMWGFAIFAIIYTVLVGFFGLAAAHLVPGLKVADQAMPNLLMLVPAGLALLVFVSILAASVSTINSVVLTLSSVVGRDIYKIVASQPTERKELFWSKLFLPIMFLFAWLFAQLKFGAIVVLSVMSAGGFMCLVPPFLGVFLWKRGTAAGVIASIILSGVTTIVLYFTKTKPLGIWEPLWGLAIATVVFVVVSLFTKPPKKAGEFLDVTNNWPKYAKEMGMM